MQTGLQQLALTGALEDVGQFFLQTLQAAECIGRLQKIDLFFGEIQRCLNQHAQIDQFFVQFADSAGKLSLQ